MIRTSLEWPLRARTWCCCRATTTATSASRREPPNGRADPERGIREFVVGTDGSSLCPIKSPIENTEYYNSGTFGVLKLSLEVSGYEWRFDPVKEGDRVTDFGRSKCH
jgi:hypothetical protein